VSTVFTVHSRRESVHDCILGLFTTQVYSVYIQCKAKARHSTQKSYSSYSSYVYINRLTLV
jgi:hypothetical protein